MLEDKYVDKDIALTRYGEGTEFSKVKKCLWGENGIPIGRNHDNPILDTIVYEVEYPDGHKASLAANTISENLFSQVYEEGNIFVLFDEMVYHPIDGTYAIPQDAFIISKNGGNRKIETTKGWEILIKWKDGSTT